MSQAIIKVVAENPNDQSGGGGCLCSDTKRPECVGPYVLFEGVETASNISPHAVACRQCLQDGLKALNGEALAPTTDRLERRPGHGVRDTTYVPVDAEDAKRPRDGSPGYYETPAEVEPKQRIERIIEDNAEALDKLASKPAPKPKVQVKSKDDLPSV